MTPSRRPLARLSACRVGRRGAVPWRSANRTVAVVTTTLGAVLTLISVVVVAELDRGAAGVV